MIVILLLSLPSPSWPMLTPSMLMLPPAASMILQAASLPLLSLPPCPPKECKGEGGLARPGPTHDACKCQVKETVSGAFSTYLLSTSDVAVNSLQHQVQAITVPGLAESKESGRRS